MKGAVSALLLLALLTAPPLAPVALGQGGDKPADAPKGKDDNAKSGKDGSAKDGSAKDGSAKDGKDDNAKSGKDGSAKDGADKSGKDGSEGKPGDGKTPERSPLETVRALVNQIKALERDLNEKRRKLRAARTPDEVKQLQAEVDRVARTLDEARLNLEKFVTGVDVSRIDSSEERTMVLEQELKTLLSPLFHELKEMTAKPRRIEKLRLSEARYKEQQPVIATALTNIRKYRESAKETDTIERMRKLEDEWSTRQGRVQNELDVVSQELKNLQQQRKPMFESLQELAAGFFQTRGRNLLFALLAMIGVFFVLRLIGRMFRAVRREGPRPVMSRIVSVVFGLLSGMAALAAALAVLYASGDWVLLSLISLLLLGAFWSAREALPRAWRQIKTLLNLGTVREGERLVINGVAWRVAGLNIFTTLENPSFPGIILRRPLEDLFDLHSRPCRDDEPWFPTVEGDVVVLADGTWGTVLTQTPETVVLKVRNGRKSYPTGSFVGQNPWNLSHGFLLATTFGLDYGLQADITLKIPATLREELAEELKNHAGGEHLQAVKVEFKEAGGSSLNLNIVTEYSGAAAGDYFALQRLVQRLTVESCNRHGWGIPFPQVTVHRAELADSPAPQEPETTAEPTAEPATEPSATRASSEPARSTAPTNAAGATDPADSGPRGPATDPADSGPRGPATDPANPPSDAGPGGV